MKEKKIKDGHIYGCFSAGHLRCSPKCAFDWSVVSCGECIKAREKILKTRIKNKIKNR